MSISISKVHEILRGFIKIEVYFFCKKKEVCVPMQQQQSSNDQSIKKGWIRVTILGSGTSTGVPVIGCECQVCRSSDPRHQRTRASVMIELDHGESIVIDTGPDFRMQMLRHRVKNLHHIFYTHIHADHCHGFDDIRAFYFRSLTPMNCYLPRGYVEEFKARFRYAFYDEGYIGTKPQVILHEVDEGRLEVMGQSFETVLLPHGNSQSMAFRLGSFAYATDFKVFPPELVDRWKGRLHTLVASGVRYRPLPTHSTLPETASLMENLGVKRGIISHLNHDVDHTMAERDLPSHLRLAYDGLVFDVPVFEAEP
jgi:phosphoribosyl 1,2-cyclic phosphate phosphodiesterase